MTLSNLVVRFQLWQYTAGHYLNQPNYSWPLESSSGFSHLWPGVFHIPLPTHKIHNREVGRKRKVNYHWLGLAPNARREKSVTLLCILCFCGITWACTRAKLPLATSNADLSTRVGQPSICRSTGFSSRLSDWSPLCSTLISWLTFSWRLSPADCPWDLPPLVLFQSRRRSRAQALCVGLAPRQTKGSSDRHPHTETNATHRVTR